MKPAATPLLFEYLLPGVLLLGILLWSVSVLSAELTPAQMMSYLKESSAVLALPALGLSYLLGSLVNNFSHAWTHVLSNLAGRFMRRFSSAPRQTVVRAADAVEERFQDTLSDVAYSFLGFSQEYLQVHQEHGNRLDVAALRDIANSAVTITLAKAAELDMERARYLRSNRYFRTMGVTLTFALFPSSFLEISRSWKIAVLGFLLLTIIGTVRASTRCLFHQYHIAFTNLIVLYGLHLEQASIATRDPAHSNQSTLRSDSAPERASIGRRQAHVKNE